MFKWFSLGFTALMVTGVVETAQPVSRHRDRGETCLKGEQGPGSISRTYNATGL